MCFQVFLFCAAVKDRTNRRTQPFCFVHSSGMQERQQRCLWLSTGCSGSTSSPGGGGGPVAAVAALPEPGVPAEAAKGNTLQLAANAAAAAAATA